MCFFFTPETDKEALKKDLSDMDYLRSKIVEKSDMVDEKEMEADEDEEKEGHSDYAADKNEEEEEEEDEEESPVQNTDDAYESGDKTSSQKSTKPAAQNTVSVIKHEV